MGDSFEQPKQLPIPQIYRLIREGATPDAICMQMYQDFTNGSIESVWLAFRALQQKKQDGLTALQHIAQGTDKLAQIAQNIVAHPTMDAKTLESLLGINRWGTVTPNSYEGLRALHAYAVGKNSPLCHFMIL